MRSSDALYSVFLHFISISLLTFGGVIATLPEIHRFAVDLEHWMSDREFAEFFAIAQVTPGPNMMIVALIGYRAAGVLGGTIAALCVAVPPAVVACLVARTFDRAKDAVWPAVFRAGLRPVSCGLVLATCLIIAIAANQSSAAWFLMALTTSLTFFTRIHPLLMLTVGGIAGFFGLL